MHLKVRDPWLQKASEHDAHGGPSQRSCPADVYGSVVETVICEPVSTTITGNFRGFGHKTGRIHRGSPRVS